MNACRLTLRPPRLGRLLAAALTAVTLLCVAACTTPVPLPDVAKNVDPKCVGVPLPGLTWITLHAEGSEGAIGAQVTVTITSKTPGVDADLPQAVTYGLPYCKVVHYKPGVILRVVLQAGLVTAKKNDRPNFSCNIKSQLGKVLDTGGPVSRGEVTCSHTTSAKDVVRFPS